MTGRCGKKAWPSSPRPLCLMFKRKRKERDPRSCLPQLQANSVSGWNRFSLRAPCASSLHHRVKGLDRTCTCVCAEVKEPTCDLRKKHVFRSALRVSAQPPKCLEEQAEPSFGECIKYVTHTATVTPVPLPYAPEGAKEETVRRVAIFVCRLIKPRQVPPLSAVPSAHRRLPALPGERNSCTALHSKTQMCFMACDNRFPPHHASHRHFNSGNIRLSPSVYSALLTPLGCH